MLAQSYMAFNHASRRNGVILSFSGHVSENVLFSLGEVLRLRMSQDATDASIAKRVFAVFVEQAQNVIRYSVDRLCAPPPEEKAMSAGFIVVGTEEERFFVVCGNEVPREDVGPLSERLEHIAKLSPSELRAFYREKLRQPPDEGSLGGSIGLIEIARRASAPVEFDFQDVGEGRAFFCLKTYI